jgi:polyisoprenoid-binding protein YceI
VLTRMLPGQSPAQTFGKPGFGKPVVRTNGSAKAYEAQINGGRAPSAGRSSKPAPRPQTGPAWLLPLAALMVGAGAMTVIYPTARPPARDTVAKDAALKDIDQAPVPGAAALWAVDLANSRLGFGGTHSGTPFKGAFERWTATITFDPANLAASKAVVMIDLASAKTGDSTYDGTLPDADWLDVKQSAVAKYETASITSKGGNSYAADGRLTLRGVTLPVVLTFDLIIDGVTARMTGRAEIQRLAFGIGKGSDAGGSWVSLAIPVEVNVIAKRR